jgi:NitT/TauT family transport system substrate-binding protein
VGLPALLGGDVQIVFTNSVSTLQAVSKGIPLTIIAQANETNGKPPNTAAVISSAAAPLTSGRDLDGKRFAVNTLGNIIWLYARHWIEQTGGHPDKVQFIELPFPSMSDALKRREIDAAFISQPFLSAALADSSIRLIGWPYSVDRRPVENSQYVTTQTFAASNSETIRHFVRALNRGVDWVNHNLNSQAFAELVSGYSKIPIADIQKIVLPPYQKVVHADALHRVMDLAHSNGLIDRPIDIPSILYVTATTPP